MKNEWGHRVEIAVWLAVGVANSIVGHAPPDIQSFERASEATRDYSKYTHSTIFSEARNMIFLPFQSSGHPLVASW